MNITLKFLLFTIIFITGKDFSRIVFQHRNEESLFSVASIHSMCQLENEAVRGRPLFQDFCIQEAQSSKCCRSWSLGNYIAQLSNKSSCFQINQSDIDYTLNLLQDCSIYYHNLSLTPSCGLPAMDEYLDDYHTKESRERCRSVPLKCKQHRNAFFNILHFITDEEFLTKRNENTDMNFNTKLQYTVSFLPLARSMMLVELYKSIEEHGFSNGETEIIAVEFGLKHALFDYYLLMDTIWVGGAVAVIFLAMWLYTASFFITVMSFISIIITFIISYFIYTMVFEIKFFPFMNQLTLVIIIGIGADDIFIYCKIWSLSKAEMNNGTLEKIVSDTLKHAVLTMLVTSLTTATAFYANYFSDITALSCFGIFSGTTVIVNFLMMVTWVPAAIVIHKKWCCEGCSNCSPDSRKCGALESMCKAPHKIYHSITEWARIFFEKILPCVVIKLRYLWLLICGSLGLFGILIIFYYPRLKLPSSDQFQMFSSNHPFEMYDFKLKNKFGFERVARNRLPKIPITIVWGVSPSAKGKKLNPFSKSNLHYDTSFDMSRPLSQKWLLKFCRRLRGMKYYQSMPGIQLTNCFIEHFKRFMERDCEGPRGQTYQPCCNAKFPYPRRIFRKCLNKWTPQLSRTKLIYGVNEFSGPRYSTKTGELVALIVEFYSNVPYTLNYSVTNEFYKNMNHWVKTELSHAPKEMRHGWFISELQFFALQDSIAKGTPIAIAISISMASVIAFLTTLNVLISLYAVVTICCAIFVTIAALVLLGWELNILESVTISIAVGLSIDFTLHYGVAYRLSPDLDKEMRVICSIGRMGTAVAMAAFTTFLAGALMMPSTVLAYRQLGTFLMLIMSISWFYSTFFLQSLLRTLGPQGGFGQFHWPTLDCCMSYGREHVDKTIYALSESTLSSSSTSNPNYHPSCSSETHELEPLTEPNTPHRNRQVKPSVRQMSNNNTLPVLKREPPLITSSQSAVSKNSSAHVYKGPASQTAGNGQTTYVLHENEADDGGTQKQVMLISHAPSETEIWIKRPEFL